MSKYIDAEKLKDEIKHLKIDVYDEAHQFDLGARCSLTFLESFIDSLQQEQPDKYETALEKARKWMPNVNQGGHAILIDIFPELGEGLDPRYGGRKQEQPEVELERELRDYFSKWGYNIYNGAITMDNGIVVTLSSIQNVARHFYELGLKARKK